MNVITISGKSYDRNLCRKIGQIFYLIGDPNVKNSGECYPLAATTDNGEETVYFKSNSPRLFWDEYSNKYRDNAQCNVVTGVINDRMETGRFGEEGLNKPLSVKLGQNIMKGIPENSIMEWNPIQYRYVLRTGTPYKTYLKQGHAKRNYDHPIYNTGFYNAADYPNLKELQRNHDNSPKKASVLDLLFEGRTFGGEFETQAGSLPPEDMEKTGVIPLKDGSIGGLEYVTLVKRGNFIVNMAELLESMSKYTVVNQNCSLHYHIGNCVPKGVDKKHFTVAFWRMYCRIQNDLEGMTFPYKRELQYLANKPGGPKDHCKILPDMGTNLKMTPEHVNHCFDNILLFLNGHQMPKKRGNIYEYYNHSLPKWQHKERYYSVNLLPFLFEEKQTIEFRLHGGTTNFYKAFYWLMICDAIIVYTGKNINKILYEKTKITLEDIITEYVMGSGIPEDLKTKLIDAAIFYIYKTTCEMNEYRISHELGYEVFDEDADYTMTNFLDIKTLI